MDNLNWGTGIKAGIAAVAAIWVGLNPLVQLLLVAMVLDIATGLLSAYVRKVIDSAVSFRGMAKKSIILLLVWGAWQAGAWVGQPLGEMVAAFYTLNEFISILENAAEAGIPVPQFLRDALAKLSSEQPPEPPKVQMGG
jgi:toxin secretion/phage lysis holin